ncbi:protein FAR-RED IMPAIRED RESPONSE 1-like [Chenopodium quinoa]|uniref:protein FAR-RED IMPAIRED RESPONSE 1-like n=1 Tax=Chenopodium quinoa TaxID=63459 RepID=UPI000B7816F2|nr:protein FAR-RED IMPAIRED RESPONSE 1-like [Chenopodium quinoa]
MFFHAHRLDQEGRLKDVLWVDARSRVAYQEFGDVVCFDATYLTNEYELPFANFVGVNHHGQSILLGCALVSHETTETYFWVFEQWLSCMGNIAPGAILIDQAAAMRKPIAQLMPSTRHRWCIWHIMRKIPEKLGKCKHYADFKSPLKTVVYESFTVEEFEFRRNALIKKYSLEDNDWLCDLFDEIHMWVPAFMKEHFWAGMKTTQRVESINSFFDGFVDRQTKLHEFPEKYTRAMKKRVQSEVAVDARCGKYVRRLVSGFRVEKLFQKIYTDAKFQEVQKECARMGYCYPKVRRELENDKTEYVLEDRVWIIPEGKSEDVITDRRIWVRVVFDQITKDVSCDCRKFETFGILCKHVIRVFEDNLLLDIPKKYILDRWRKDVPRKHTRVKVAYHDPGDTPQVQHYRRMMREFEGICDEASAVDDIDTVDMVISSLKELRLNVKESRKKFIVKQAVLPTMPANEVPPSEIGSNSSPTQLHTPSSVANDFPKVANVKDPIHRKKPRGRPKTTRYKSSAEKGYKIQKPSAAAKKTQQMQLALNDRASAICPDAIETLLYHRPNIQAILI